MLVVIEGADRAGKSTLASALADRMVGFNSNTFVVHRSKPSAHPLAEYETYLDEAYLVGGTNMVLDRWHWGERVWPEVFGRDTEYDRYMLRHTEMYLRSRGAVIVYASRRDRAAWHADLVANDEPITGENGLPLALDLYQDCRDAGYGTEIPYDFTRGDGAEWFPAMVIREAHKAEATVAPIHELTEEWLGSPTPRTLLVGDRFGVYRPGSPNVPFAPYKGSCGHYLMQALAVQDDWADVAIVNSTRGDGTPERIFEIWAAMAMPRIIAMGREAQSILAREDRIPGEAWDGVPHPQYWRRFQRKAGLGAYHDMFKEAGL